MKEEHGVAGNELNSKLEFTHQNLEKMTRIVKKTRKKALKRILKKFIKRESKWGFKTWKRRVYGVLGKHRKMMKAATWFTNKSVRKVWRSWQVYIKMCKSDKRKMLKSSAFMQNKVIAVAYFGWKGYCNKRKQLRKLLVSIFTKKIFRHRSNGFKSWKGKTVGSEVTRELRRRNEFLEDQIHYLSLTHICVVLKKNHMRAMGRAWGNWYSEATSGVKVERLLKRGAGKVRRRMLRRDFNTWTEAISKKLMTKRLLKRICEHTKRRLLQKGMKKWERFLEQILLKEHENNVWVFG